MSDDSAHANAIFQEEIVVAENAIDRNGHVNNVVFVQWMQDIAVRHFESAGCSPMMHAAGGAWVARTHHIEYLSPAFLNDRLQVSTWIVDFGRVRSLRRYKFVRVPDAKTVVRGETDWVFVSAKSGRPSAIPDQIIRAFTLRPQDF